MILTGPNTGLAISGCGGRHLMIAGSANVPSSKKKMKIKLCVIGVREWEKTNDISGETVSARFVQFFDEKNKPGEFRTDREIGDPLLRVRKILKYDGELAVTFDLYAAYDSFKQKMKLAEVGHDGRPEPEEIPD